MLTPSQRRTLDQNGLATSHDYWTESLTLGEPFFEDGTVVYYDGRLVTISSFSLRGEEPVDGALVRALSKRWVIEREAEAISYYGPIYVDFRHLKTHGLQYVERYKGDRRSAELFIDCSAATSAIHDLWFYKLAVKKGFRSKHRTGGVMSAEHLRLIETFYRNAIISGYQAKMAFVLPALLRSRRIHLIEAWLGNRLCGFATLHKAFSDIAVGLFLAHDYQTPRVSDFLYGETIIYAEQLGIRHINVGASPDIGHYDFKRKWGGEPLVPPHYYSLWARGRMAKRYHIFWGPRIVRL